MKCETCHRSPLDADSPTIYRINILGVAGIWRCEKHLPKGFVIDPELKEVVQAIERKDKKE